MTYSLYCKCTFYSNSSQTLVPTTAWKQNYTSKCTEVLRVYPKKIVIRILHYSDNIKHHQWDGKECLQISLTSAHYVRSMKRFLNHFTQSG